MNFEEARKLLGECERSELRDHAFGDREVFWKKDDVEVAGGYFGGGGSSVWVNHEPEGDPLRNCTSFSDDEARELAKCGKLVAIDRNDRQGDDIPDYRGA